MGFKTLRGSAINRVSSILQLLYHANIWITRNSRTVAEHQVTSQNSSHSDCVGDKLGLNGVNTRDEQGRGREGGADGGETSGNQPLLV